MQIYVFCKVNRDLFVIVYVINTTTAQKFCTCMIGRSGPWSSMFELKTLSDNRYVGQIR